MNEKLIERKLREAVKAKGGKAYKFTSPSNSGVFDRIVLMPGKQIWFVETKTTGKKLTALQQLFKKDVELLGFETRVIDDQKTLNDFLHEI
jgi:hypothetical protein